MSHFLRSEFKIPVARLTKLEDNPGGLHVYVFRRKLEHSEDTLKPLHRVIENVFQMVERLLKEGYFRPTWSRKPVLLLLFERGRCGAMLNVRQSYNF